MSFLFDLSTIAITLILCVATLHYYFPNIFSAGRPKSKYISTLQDPCTTTTSSSSSSVNDSAPLSSNSILLSLLSKTKISHNVVKFRFALPSDQHVLNLPIGQHISLKYTTEEGKLVARSYTPVSNDDDDVGYVDLVVKIYFKNVHERFPEGGKMSQHLNDMAIGESIMVSGPKGKLAYMGQGTMNIKHRARDLTVEVRKATKIGMIAGGTGITPMLQILNHALADPKDTTEFHLIFANQSEDDILLRDALDTMALNHSNVKIWYTVDKVLGSAEEWKFSVGFVNASMIQTHLPPPGPETQILVCGPPVMIKFALLPAFEELGYTPAMHFAF